MDTRCLLVLVGVAIAVNAVIVIDDVTVDQNFELFKKDHNKVYSTPEEERYRRSLFEESLQRVFVHQLAFDRGEETYTKGINQFSDMKYEEIFGDERRITCKAKRAPVSNHNETVRHREWLISEFGVPPASINWITKGKVHSVVRNQNIGACGGCYAFGAVSAIESAYAVKHSLDQKDIPQLSEQMAIDCSSAQKYGCNGCDGGFPIGVYKMVIDKKGLKLAADYPWRQDQKKLHGCHNAKKVNFRVELSGYKEYDRVKAEDADKNLMTIVGTVGPVTASVCSSKSFVEYKNGVFKDKDCFKNCGPINNDGINHTLMAVGYTKNYFILRNSWGTGWGDHGNMKIARVQGTPLCNLGSDQSYAIAK